MNPDPATDFARQTLEQYRLTFLPRRHDTLHDVRLPENLARFLHCRVVPTQPDEHLGALFLDADLWPIAHAVPYLGYNGLIRTAAFFVPGILAGAAGLVLFHHRPAAVSKPTRRDLKLARRVRDEGEVMGLRLLDHFLLGTGESWVSLGD